MSWIDNNIKNIKDAPSITADIFANIPSSASLGALFIATDLFEWYRYDGAGWILIGGAGVGTITGSLTSGSIVKAIGTTTIADAIPGTDYVEPAALASYLPLTGGTLTGSLTASSFVKSGGTSSEFLKADGSTDSNIYALSSALASYLPLTGGTITGSLTASSFVKSGGTSSQFLKADGSTDSNIYALSSALASYLPLTGGTLTGTLSGTDANFNVLNTTGTGLGTGLNVYYWSIYNDSSLNLIFKYAGFADILKMDSGSLNVLSNYIYYNDSSGNKFFTRYDINTNSLNFGYGDTVTGNSFYMNTNRKVTFAEQNIYQKSNVEPINIVNANISLNTTHKYVISDDMNNYTFTLPTGAEYIGTSFYIRKAGLIGSSSITVNGNMWTSFNTTSITIYGYNNYFTKLTYNGTYWYVSE